MKKRRIIALLLACTTLFTACGKNTDTQNTITTEDGKVILCDYKHLTGEKKIYRITQEQIDSSVDEMLYDYIEYKEVKRASKDGDVLDTALKVTVDNEALMDEKNYEILLGEDEFGEEFDEKLTRAKKGDEFSFSVTYPEDSNVLLSDNTSLAGLTANYQVTINKITEEIIPSLTEEFIEKELGFESKDAMYAYIQTELMESHESESLTELRENLLQQVIDKSTITKYDSSLYDEAKTATYDSYRETATMFGFESPEALFEEWEIADEDLEKEILNLVYRTIVVQAICKENDTELTDEEFSSGIESYTEQFDYESADALINDYGEDTLRIWLTEDKVMDILYENATITEVEATIEDEE